MLGPFFGIGQEFFRQPAVFILVGSAGPRAGQRANRHDPVFDADHNFGRTADQIHTRRFQQKHKRTRIDDPQRAIDLKRSRRSLPSKSLADDDLEDVARADVFLAAGDGRLKFRAGNVRLPSGLRLHGQANVAQPEFARGTVQLGAQLVDAGCRAVVSRSRIAFIGACVCDDQDRFIDLIKNYHPVVKRERHIGDVTVIIRRVGQVLAVAHDVVAGVSDRSAAKPRQSREMDGLVFREQSLEIPQRVGGLKLLAGSLAGHDHVVPECFDSQERIGAENAVAPDLFSSDDTLEEERRGTTFDAPIRFDGRERVPEEPAINGNDPAFRGEAGKSVVIRKGRHRSVWPLSSSRLRNLFAMRILLRNDPQRLPRKQTGFRFCRSAE